LTTNRAGNRSLKRLIDQIHPRRRLVLWGLRLILGAMLLAISEIVMWQNPPAHSLLEWATRAVLYVALAAILIDVTVRFQAHEIAALGLVCGLYGLVCGTIVTHNALNALPISLIVRALGLQTGAAFYGLIFFISVMRGRQVEPREIAGAAAIGLLWGIWIKWYPAQAAVGWGSVTIESATLYIVGAFVIIGALIILIAPRFRVIRETDLQLLWWEWILVGIPLFIALLVGMSDENVIPALPFALVTVIAGFVIGGLFLQKHGFEPSLMAEVTITAPNAQTYVILFATFLIAGVIGAAIIGNNVDSIIGAGAYVLVGAIGALWLPVAFALVGLRAYRRED